VGEITVQTVHRIAVLAFMALVTTCLLALVFGLASRGWSGLAGMVVYGFAAGFGLEFLGAAWSGRFAGRRRRLPS